MIPTFDPGASREVRRNPYLFGPCFGPSNGMRKYFLRTNKRLASECGGQPSHYYKYRFPRKRLFAVAGCARHHNACAMGSGGNDWIATWVPYRSWSASKIWAAGLECDAEY